VSLIEALGASRDGDEIEALITDRYLDSLLELSRGPVLQPVAQDPASQDLDLAAAVREVSRRLATDLPRFHPSFRFEERLAVRLAELAAPTREAPGARDPIPIGAATAAPSRPTIAAAPIRSGGQPAEPRLLLGGAVAASAISLAGAWLAWRRRTPMSPMARAIRAAHAGFRSPTGNGA
jgi:hypothetical protein